MTAEFTKIVLYYLNEKNISFELFSVMLNVHPKQVNNMLKGDYNFDLRQMVRIEVALDIKIFKVAGQD